MNAFLAGILFGMFGGLVFLLTATVVKALIRNRETIKTLARYLWAAAWLYRPRRKR